MSNIIGNRNSTPETANSSLRPPSSRAIGGHHLRASADMSAFSTTPLSTRGIRPASEIYLTQHQGQSQASAEDTMEKAAQQWIADIDQYEQTLEEMAAARMDQDFKDELSAIEQWFRVLSEPERTAALYTLLQQSSQVQIRFFIQVLQQMAKSLPMSGVLSPANFGEKDPMSNRFSDAMSKLTAEGSRNSFTLPRPPPSPNIKRHSQLDPVTISSMFPDAVAAIAKQKEEFIQYTGNAPTSNRNSLFGGNRSSLVTPTISAPDDKRKDSLQQPVRSPWGQAGQAVSDAPQQPISRPKSSSGPQTMGQFSQPLPSAGLRSSRPSQPSVENNPLNSTFNAENNGLGMPMLSPFPAGASWASMSNTPMVSNFQVQQQNASQAEMIANATAMKLAAMSTVTNRIQLDDVRKYRRARSTDGQSNVAQQPLPAGFGGSGTANFVMTNEFGQVLTPQQAAALQAQQLAQLQGQRSRPSSPGFAMPGSGLAGINLGFPQNNGFLTAYDPNNALAQGLAGINLGQFGVGVGAGHEGYLSDASEINRGRSPRGRRGSSKPPEDPTDINLLRNIPEWLRALRLHKYTDNLKNVRWQDLIELDDAGLEEHGVNALGARRKLIKVFEQVKEAQDEGRVPPS